MAPEEGETVFAAAREREEERRLFYVGMTRAQHVLVMTSAASRKIFGSFRSRPVSPFIAELPAALCCRREQPAGRRKKKGAEQMKLFS